MPVYTSADGKNHQIKLRNLGVEGDRIRGEVRGKTTTARDENKTNGRCFEGLVNFVPKAADYIAEKEEYIQEQILKANDEAKPHNYSLYSEEHRSRKSAGK